MHLAIVAVELQKQLGGSAIGSTEKDNRKEKLSLISDSIPTGQHVEVEAKLLKIDKLANALRDCACAIAISTGKIIS